MTTALDLSVGWIEVLLFLLMLVIGVWNTAVGPTGGIAFATLSAVLTPTVAVPIQAIVEGVSGMYRGWELRRHINVDYVRLFVLGGTVGLSFGYGLLDGLSDQPESDRFDSTFTLVVAGMILVTTWLPVARSMAERNAAPVLVGATTTAMSLFVGGMGAPITASLAGRGTPHSTVIATATVAVMAQYLARLVIFGLIGFSLADNLPLIVLLTIGSTIGTLIGKRVLLDVDPAKARLVFKVVVTVIAASMILRVGMSE